MRKLCSGSRQIPLPDLEIPCDGLLRLPIESQASMMQYQNAAAEFCQRIEIMGNDQHCAFSGQFLQFPVAFLLEKHIAYAERLIDNENFRFHINGDRKCQAHKHP